MPEDDVRLALGDAAARQLANATKTPAQLFTISPRCWYACWSGYSSRRVSTGIYRLNTKMWKEPAFFLTHPAGIAAFGRECTRRGVPPPTVSIFGSQFLTWRGIPYAGCPAERPAAVGHPGAVHAIHFLGEASAYQDPFYFVQSPAQTASAFDVQAVRKDFPILAERVNGRPLMWLDNAATTQKPQAVLDRLGF